MHPERHRISGFVTGTGGRKDFWLNAFNNPNFSASRYAPSTAGYNDPWSVENRADPAPHRRQR